MKCMVGILFVSLMLTGCASKYWVANGTTYLKRGPLDGKVEIELDSEGKARKMVVEDKLKVPDLSFFPITLGGK